jgi:hypothetical protein
MQNTRLNSLIAVAANQFGQWLNNPWRRLSLLLLGLLFGFFLANVISTTTGQTADLDILVSVILLAFVEVVNRLVYGQRPRSTDLARPAAAPSRPITGLDILNALKLGITYGLFLEAFKLGS